MLAARVLLATLAIAAPLAAGCGDDSDDGGGSSGGAGAATTAAAATGLAKEDLAQRADALCKTAKADLDKVQEPANIQDANQAAQYLGAIAPITTKLQNDLEALEPAADVKADYDAFLTAQRKGTDLLVEVAEKAKAKDASGLQQLQQLGDLDKDVVAAAGKLGMKECGGGS